MESPAQLSQVGALFAFILERPGELDQYRAEFPGLDQWIKSLAEGAFIFAGELVALVREDLVELCRENEVRVMGDAFQPHPGRVGPRRIVKAAIDLGGIKVFRYQRQRIELRTGALGIDASAPVSI